MLIKNTLHNLFYLSDNVGRRERQRERRLLKGFTVGLFEQVVAGVMSSNKSLDNDSPETFNRMTSVKQRQAKMNWNDIVSKIKDNQNHIGFSRGDSLRHSIDTLRREVVLEEHEVRSIHDLNDPFSTTEHLKGLARFIAVAKSLQCRDIPDEVFAPLASLREEDLQLLKDSQKFRNFRENLNETVTRNETPVPLDVNIVVKQLSADNSQTPEICPDTCKEEVVADLQMGEKDATSEKPQNNSPTTLEARPPTPARRNSYGIKPLDRKPKGGWM